MVQDDALSIYQLDSSRRIQQLDDDSSMRLRTC